MNICILSKNLSPLCTTIYCQKFNCQTQDSYNSLCPLNSKIMIDVCFKQRKPVQPACARAGPNPLQLALHACFSALMSYNHFSSLAIVRCNWTYILGYSPSYSYSFCASWCFSCSNFISHLPMHAQN